MDRFASLSGALLCAVLSSTSFAQGEIPECKDTKKTASGLEYCVLKAGSADEPGPGPEDVVEVHYTGWLASGKKFESTRERNQPYRTRVDEVVKGWSEGLQLMTPGARFKLTIPPELGYGAVDKGVIPPNSTIIFELELLSIRRMPRFKPANAEAQKTTDSGLKYQVLKAGAGEKPAEDDVVVMRFAMFNDQGKRQMCTEDRGQKIIGTREQMPLPFLKELFGLVKRGDVVRAEVPPKLGGGDQPVGNLPAGQSSIWEVEVLEVKQLPKFRPANAAATTTTDSGLKYQVVKVGTGPMVGAEDGASFRFAMFTAEGKLMLCTELQGEKIGGKREQLLFPFLKELSGIMKQGEVVRAEVPAAIGPSAQQVRGLPAGATTIWEVELLGVGRAPKLEPSAPEKLKRTDSGLQYEVIRQGEGRKPGPEDSVLAHYTGWFPDGRVFDSSYLRCEASEFSLTRVIRGWIEGVQMMNEGSIYQFVVPPDLAYGERGYEPGIPPNATLVFRIELVKVK